MKTLPGGIRITTSDCVIRALVISNFTGYGVLLEGNARGNLIGGTNSGAGNAIVSSGASGVAIVTGTNNAIRGNSIFGNGTLGIDLQDGGVTSNDGKDPDMVPNNLQNFPILSSATISSNSVAIAGSLNSRPDTSFQIDFFANQTCDDSGNGEGQIYLGTRIVSTPSGGTVSFNSTLTAALVGRYITATATDPFGNTSEFSPCLRAASTLPPLTFSVVNTNDSGPGSLRQATLDVNARGSASIASIGWIGSYYDGPPQPLNPDGSYGYGPADRGTITGFMINIWANVVDGVTGINRPDYLGSPLLTLTVSGNAGETDLGYQDLEVTYYGPNERYGYGTAFPTPFAATGGTTYWLSIIADSAFAPEWGWATAGLNGYNTGPGGPYFDPAVSLSYRQDTSGGTLKRNIIWR